MSKVNDPIAQQIHQEKADRMLASFVVGLSGVVGCQVRYVHPKYLREAVNLALAVDEAEKQVTKRDILHAVGRVCRPVTSVTRQEQTQQKRLGTNS